MGSNATEVAYNLSLAQLLRQEGLNAEGAYSGHRDHLFQRKPITHRSVDV